MFQFLKPTLGPLILRVGLAVIFLFNGYTKITINGGAGWSEDLEDWVQVGVAWGELAAGLALLVGLLTRLVALAITVEQVVAIALVTGEHGFQINVPPGAARGLNLKDVGPQYNFAIIVMCLTLLVIGGGVLALDHLLWRRTKK
jgi:uncharacterized membrane protein YphA (DoxX/SURF4 family)